MQTEPHSVGQSKQPGRTQAAIMTGGMSEQPEGHRPANSKQPGRTQAAIMTGQSEGPKAINLKVKDALVVLGISRTTLYKAWLEGWGPQFFWVGKSRRIPLEAALAWRGKPAEGGE